MPFGPQERFFPPFARLKRRGIPWMMKQDNRFLPFSLSFAAALLVLLPAVPARAQVEPGSTLPKSNAPSKAPAAAPAQSAPAAATPAKAATVEPAKAVGSAEAAAQAPDRAVAYF